MRRMVHWKKKTVGIHKNKFNWFNILTLSFDCIIIYRLTVSLFGNICKLREKTSRVKTVMIFYLGHLPEMSQLDMELLMK
jgi:hypothetical protein